MTPTTNGAPGVLASVLAVIFSMAYGINVTMTLAARCYFALVPLAGMLRRSGAPALEH